MTEPKPDINPTQSDKRRQFEALSRSIRIGNVALRNRMVFPAMATGFGTTEGYLTERIISYYLERARGGAGLIIVEPTAVLPGGRHTTTTMLMHDDNFVPMHQRLTQVLHDEGARVILQLLHAGRKTSLHVTGARPVGPSAEADLDFGETPVELTSAGIGEIVDAFVSAAKRASAAGYDGVEVLASGGFLLHQFLSADSNHRADAWGGAVGARAKIVTDIIAGIRGALPQALISVRMGPGRNGHYSIEMADLLETASLAAAAGASVLDVALGSEMLQRTDDVPIASPGTLQRPVEPEVKGAVTVPVIGGGSIFDLPRAEKLVAGGRVDLVAFGRPIVTDPHLPSKLIAGRAAQVRPCIHCNVCLGRPPEPTMTCPANPMVGREQLFWLGRRGAGHHVVVVGTGLAGLWSALIAADLGYTVEVFDPGSVVGNLLALRSRIPGQTENYRIVDYLSRELQMMGVGIHMRRRVAVRDILEQRPDAVFVARIGKLNEPDIKGLSNVQAVDPLTVLSSEPTMGDKVVLLGGGLMGAEIAYYLARRGKKVTLLDERSRVASDTHPELRQKILASLREMDCRVYVGVHNIQVNVYGELTAQHERRTLKLPIDTVILASNYHPCDDTFNELEGKVKELHLIGDAYETAELTRLVYRATGALIDMADRL